jgi:predicted metalloprotease with PDZ domain
MFKRISLFFFVWLLAGATVGLAGGGWPQDDKQDEGVRAFSLFLGGGSYLGVNLEEVTSETAKRLGMQDEHGALLTEVVADSPAAKAGLQKDDVVVEWNGVRVESAMQFRRHVQETPAGRTARLTVFRNGREVQVDVKLGTRSDERGAFKYKVNQETQERMRAAQERVRQSQERLRESLKNRDLRKHIVISERGRIGVSLQSLTPQLAEYFGLPGKSGALVTSVREDSPAAKAGLKAGDVIISVDGQAVDDPSDALRIIRKKDEGPMEIKVLRDKHERTFSVEMEKRQTSEYFDEGMLKQLIEGAILDEGMLKQLIEGAILEPLTDFVVPMPEIEIRGLAPLAVPAPKIKVPSIQVLKHPNVI